MQCPTCKEIAPPDGHYCQRCGQPLYAAALPLAERRRVTIVFADLAGFTAFSAERDAEEVATVVDGVLRALSEVVIRHGGVVDKYLGDGLMALFGAPIAHEDDPQRALRAALEMPAALRVACERLGLAQPFPLHVGISSGLVVAGRFGDTSARSYTVIGARVNEASRLCDLAQAGQILVSPTTRQLTRAQFSFEPQPAQVLKGFAHPLVPYRLLGSTERERRSELRLLDSLPLRADEIQRLEERVRLLLDRGQGGVLPLLGQAGLGKSHLLSALEQRVPADLHWLGVQAISYHEGLPGSFFRELLAGWVGLESGDNDHPLAEIVLRHAERLSAREAMALYALMSVLALPLPPLQRQLLSALGPDGMQQYAQQAARQWVSRASQLLPSVIIVDDAQWVDELSQSLLRALLPLTQSLPVLFFFVSREPLPLLDEPSIEPAVTLRPITAEAMERLARERLGGPIAPALLDAIVERSSGNPLFLQELLASLSQQGLLVEVAGSWQLAEGDEQELAIPSSLWGLLQGRIDRLAPASRQLLQLASLLGRSFSVALLHAVAAREALPLEPTLSSLVGDELLHRNGDMLTFTHSMMQEVTYRSMLLRDLRARHRRVGELLEALSELSWEERLPRLARHFAASDDPERALHYTLLSAERAQRLFAMAEAVRQYEQADALWDEVQPDSPTRESLSEAHGDALRAAGRLAEAVKRWQQIDLERCPLPQASRLLSKMGVALTALRRPAEARLAFQQGLAALGEGDEVGEALLWAGLGQLLLQIGEYTGAVTSAARALVITRQQGLHETMALIYNTIGCAYARLGEAARGQQALERSLDIALRYELHEAACRGYANLALLLAASAPQRARALAAEGLALAQRIGNLTWEGWLHTSLASTACQAGDGWQAGLESAQRAAELSRLLGDVGQQAVPLLLGAQILHCQGAVPESEQLYQEALARAEQADNDQQRFLIYDGLAALYLEVGDEEQALPYVTAAAGLRADYDFDAQQLRALPFLA